MTPAIRSLAILALCLGFKTAAASALADSFETVTDESEFVRLIEDRDLKRFAIRLRVTPEGDIVGRGYGRDVTGGWRWEAGYFCRDLYWGETDLGFNCQQVLRNGSTLRFIENRGAGRYADLQLD